MDSLRLSWSLRGVGVDVACSVFGVLCMHRVCYPVYVGVDAVCSVFGVLCMHRVCYPVYVGVIFFCQWHPDFSCWPLR